MRIDNLALRTVAVCLLSAAASVSCGSGGNSTGTAGHAGGGTSGAAGTGSTGAAGTKGTGTAGTGGAGQTTTGAAGTGGSGQAGTGAAGNGSTGTGTAGTGTAGTTAGNGGSTAGTGGSSGSGQTGTAGAGSAGTSGGAAYKCPAGPFTNPTPSSLTPTRVAGVPNADTTVNQDGYGFSTIEGPVWIGDALYVSEIAGTGTVPPSRIFKIAADGTVSVAIPDAGSNGLAVDSRGNLVSANHKVGGIVSFAPPSWAATTVVGTYMGTRFISPNDLTFRSDGTLYFTDPSYQGQQGASSQTQTRVYRVAPGASEATVVDANLNNPNGITLSLDETKLYITDASGLHVYPVAADGTVGSGSPFAQGVVSSGDGMAIDCAGNLYVAVPNSGNVVVISPAGTSLGNIVVTGVYGVTNAAFGGADHKTLYITAQGQGAASPSGVGGSAQGLFKVAMPLPGMPY